MREVEGRWGIREIKSREDREDGVENRQVKRDRDRVGWLGGTIGTDNGRVQSSGHVIANVGILFVLETAPSHALIPPNQNGTMAKGRYMRRENVLGKIQP